MRRLNTTTMLGGWAVAMLFALPALAAEGGAAEPSIFAGTIGNAIVTLIIFALVITILGRLAWAPMLKLLNDRERRIRESLENAKREREEAEQLLADYRAQLDKAKSEAGGIIEQGRRDAEEVRRRIQDEARGEADQMIARAKREIELATESAKSEVYDLAADLAVGVASRVIEKELSADDHRALISESLKRIAAEKPKLN